MATVGRSENSTEDATAVRLREAGFVRLVAVPTGDAVGAAALLARGLEAADTPYQLSVGLSRTIDRATDADLTVGVGHAADEPAVALDGPGPVSRRAATIAEALGESDPVLAAAGTIASGGTPEETVATPGEGSEPSAGESRLGVGTPTVSPADGLGHSTLVHASFSGRPERAAELLADADEPPEDSTADRETVASLVALTVAEEAETPTAAEAIERFLSPQPGGPLGTVAGLADVLDALAEPSPGLAAGLALGYSDRERTLEAWRTAAGNVHEAVRTAELSRYDGLVVAELETSAPLAPTTRLLREYRSPEPVVAVLDGAAATAATPPESGPDLAAATRSIDGTAGTPDRVRLDDPGAAEELVAGLREVA